MKKILLIGIISLISLSTNALTAHASTNQNTINSSQAYSETQTNYNISSSLTEYKTFYVETAHSVGTTIIKRTQNISKTGFQPFIHSKMQSGGYPLHDGSGNSYGYVNRVDKDTFNVATNFFIINNKLYHSDPSTGKSSLGLTTVNGDVYYFNKSNTDPYAVKGWYTTEGNRYYFNENGKAATGFNIIDGETYFFDEAGRMQKGVKVIDGKTYFFDNTGDSSGEVVTGWYSFSSGHRFYFNPDEGGAAYEGWMHGDKAGPMYFDENGVMQKGVTKIGDDYYLFLTNGEGKNAFQKYGWYTDTKTGNRYYFDKNQYGEAVKGTKVIAGRTYHFSQEGVLQS